MVLTIPFLSFLNKKALAPVDKSTFFMPKIYLFAAWVVMLIAMIIAFIVFFLTEKGIQGNLVALALIAPVFLFAIYLFLLYRNHKITLTEDTFEVCNAFNKKKSFILLLMSIHPPIIVQVFYI